MLNNKTIIKNLSRINRKRSLALGNFDSMFIGYRFRYKKFKITV